MNNIGLISNAVVVTRHAGLIEYLREINLIDDTATIISHATEDNVAGKEVVGVLPHSLSCKCLSFTEVPLLIPSELRGCELTLADMRKYAKPPIMYRVVVVS